ncbi:hypothetical protein BOX15_Mlig024078g1 [Macrostomum lignano]|uniref:Uncharacterized protein n=1 Tax=Macrostomum lignano TaxID=282301 RepID=A0A267FZ66_9PLAT|nr:hypothetical protein BOX15_Mlig024078g1 [Macrostomum lignano]
MAQSRPLPPIPNSGGLGDVSVRNARSNLLEAIRDSRQLDYGELLQMQINQKYKLVDARAAMSGDKKSAEDVKRSCLFLRNKLKHLLRPERDRPPDWHRVQASFCQCLSGVDQLLERIGFERNDQNFTITSERLSNEALADTLVDLYLLAEELSLIIKDNHPLGAKLIAKNEQPALRRAGPSGMQDRVNAMQRKLNQNCDLCGEAAATVACQEKHCSKRRLCESCDGRWHGHPDRRSHNRRKISDAVGSNAVRLLPPGVVGPASVQLNSGVRKVVSNSQAVSYKSQLGLMGNNSPNLAQQQQQPAPVAAAAAAAPAVAVPPPRVPPPQYPGQKPRYVLPQQQPQQPPRQQPSDTSESDARVMKLNEFMMSLKPISEERSFSKPAGDIRRPPTPEEEFFDCSDQLPPQPSLPAPQPPQPPQQPQSIPKPKPRLSKSIVPKPETAPPPPQQQLPPRPVPTEPTEANSWPCPVCTALNPIAETKLIKSSRVICSVCSMTCDDKEIIAKVKKQQQEPAVKQPEAPKQVEIPDRAPLKPKQEPLSNEQDWSCSACTMLNPITAKSCAICQTPRELGGSDGIKLPFEVKPVARQRNPEMEAAANRQLMKLIQDIEFSGFDGRLGQLYLVATADDGAQSEAGFKAWVAEKWPALIEQVGCEVAKVLQDTHAGVADVILRPSFDEIASAVLDNTCDLEAAIQLCAQRHVAKVAWIAENCPELLQSPHEVNLDMQGDQTNLFEMENQRAFNDFAKFLFSKEGTEEPKFRQMNTSKASFYCLMGEFDIRKIEDAERFRNFLCIDMLKCYDIKDLAEAAKNCFDVESVQKYFSYECKSCFEPYPKHKLLLMASCQCEFCHECFHMFVCSVIRNNRHVTELHCPYCTKPNANQTEELQSHFATLLDQIRNFHHDTVRFEKQDVDLIENKIAEWNLYLDDNFRWCSQCRTGLMLPDIILGKKYQCPECHKHSCKDCNKPWRDQHEELSCDQFEQWLQDNDPKYQEEEVASFLRENGIQCPNCRYQYELSKGGCEHFTCRKCKFQFCAGCKGEFFTDKSGKGLACKHPRDCLYYIRDYGVNRLQQLLLSHEVEFKKDIEPAVEECQLMMQKDTLSDEACGAKVNPGQANLCEKHYIEYLVALINRKRLDPVSVMEENELRAVCNRHGIDCSGVPANSLDALRDMIVANVPLGAQN